ncbi:MAG TPA: hypothetical protein VLX58_17360 [Bryobacteraceae bacterium]|nr:hypothetical protein [Bryobacteraceae bacterium]
MATDRAVNKELRQIWGASTNFRPDATERIVTIDRKIENIRRAVEEGLNDANWANSRLRELHAEKESLIKATGNAGRPPQLDAVTAMEY